MKHFRTNNSIFEKYFPHLGQRIVKTTIAVLLCLLVYYFLGYRGQQMPTEAAITAIMCMLPYVRDTREYAVTRVAGTMLGAFWSLILLLLLYLFPSLGEQRLLLHVLMALGVMLSLYSAVQIQKSDAAGLAAVVFLCIVISFPEVEAPLRKTMLRICDVFLGTFVAIAVNTVRLPRSKNDDAVFFVRAKDLAPDRFTQISPTTQFLLNRLYGDGAMICLMSEHAPAFLTLQISTQKLCMPLIVMDGAAIYDADENVFLWKQTIGSEASVRIRSKLDALGYSYFIYTIHRDKTCVFHSGEMQEKEQAVYERMRRSVYRSYLDGEILETAEIVYFKIISDHNAMAEIAIKVRRALEAEPVRVVRRAEAGTADADALYIYDAHADMAHAETQMMDILHADDPTLYPVELALRSGYHSERDAIHLLHMIEKEYEPVQLWNRREK